MSKNVRIVVIVIFILVVLGLCSGACLCVGTAGFSSIMSAVFSTGSDIKSDILTEVCESHGDFSRSKYKDWFSASYRDSQDYDAAKEIVGEAFPSGYDCKLLQTKNIIELINQGQSISISEKNGVSTATFSFKNNEKKEVTFELEEKGSKWEITAISVSKTSK